MTTNINKLIGELLAEERTRTLALLEKKENPLLEALDRIKAGLTNLEENMEEKANAGTLDEVNANLQNFQKWLGDLNEAVQEVQARPQGPDLAPMEAKIKELTETVQQSVYLSGALTLEVKQRAKSFNMLEKRVAKFGDQIITLKEFLSDQTAKGEKIEAGVRGAIDSLQVEIDERLSQLKDGKDGKDGIDRLICAPRFLNKNFDSVLEQNELVIWKGGIFQTIRTAHGTPEDDPNSYRCLVAGIADVAMREDWVTRSLETEILLSNGDILTFEQGLGPRYMAKFPAGALILKGDWRIDEKREFLEIALADAPTSEQWERYPIRGARGRKGLQGDVGPVGPAGLGIVNTWADDGYMFLEMSNGEIKQLDFGRPNPYTGQQPIRRYVGNWRQNLAVLEGDVVTGPYGLYLAINEAQGAELSDTTIFVRMLKRSSGGGGLGGDSGGGLGGDVSAFRVMTQAEYDALDPKDSKTVYYICENP